MINDWGGDYEDEFEVLYQGDPNPCWIWPEYDLLIEMVKQAVRDMASIEQEIHEDAIEWVMAEGESDTPMSFDWICGELNLNPATTRAKMKILYTNIRSSKLLGMRTGRSRGVQRPDLCAGVGDVK